MRELTNLRNYFKMQFDQLDYICNSPSPWVLLCLSAFIDYLSMIPDSRPSSSQSYGDFIIHRYPAKYRNFKYRGGQQDLPNQMYLILRNGLVHSFSLTPNARGRGQGARQRSLYLAHGASGLRHLGHYVDTTRGIDAAILIAENLLLDTKTVVEKLIRRAERNRRLKQSIIDFIKSNPPISGSEQDFFWLK